MTDEIHEYKVRPVTRYIVTSFHRSEDGELSGSIGHGEFESADTAYAVAYALCKQEHEHYGFPAFDDRIKYPEHPDQMDSCHGRPEP